MRNNKPKSEMPAMKEKDITAKTAVECCHLYAANLSGSNRSYSFLTTE
jgi:hypothetical protein